MQKIYLKILYKKALYLSLKVFRTKVLIGDIFTSPTGDGTAIFTWSSEPREDLAACSAKSVPSLLSYFRTLRIGPAQGIKRSTD